MPRPARISRKGCANRAAGLPVDMNFRSAGILPTHTTRAWCWNARRGTRRGRGARQSAISIRASKNSGESLDYNQYVRYRPDELRLADGQTCVAPGVEKLLGIEVRRGCQLLAREFMRNWRGSAIISCATGRSGWTRARSRTCLRVNPRGADLRIFEALCGAGSQ